MRAAAARLAGLGLDPALRLAAAIVVLERLVLGVIGRLSAGPQQPASPAALTALVDGTGSLAGAVVGPWQRDDGLWYQWIATSGYGSHPAEAAFFPLYPGLVHAVGVILGGAYGLAALLVSSLALLAALILLHRLVSGDMGEAVARRTVIYTACAPFAFFFLAPFSESLFLMLSVGALLAARRRSFLAAGLLAGLATACRLQGLALLVPLVAEAVIDIHDRMRRGHRPRRGLVLAHAAVLVPFLALALVLLYLGSQTPLRGGFFAVESQYWSVHLALPWTVAAHSLQAIRGGGHPEEVANLLVGILILALLPLMWRRLPRSYTLYTAALGVPLWFHENGYSPMMSAGRFSSVVFPIFVLLAVLTPSSRRQRTVAAMLALMMVTFFFNFTRYHFVG